MTQRRKIKWGVICICLAVCGVWLWLGRRNGSGSTLGQSVNAAIDNLVATGVRLLELPVIFLLAGGAVLAVVLALPVLRWGTRSGRLRPAAIMVTALIGAGLLGLALAADHKIEQLQSQVMELRGQLRQMRMESPQVADVPSAPSIVPTKIALSTSPVALPEVTATRPTARASGVRPATAASVAVGTDIPAERAVTGKRDAFLFDSQKIPKDLGTLFGAINFHPLIQDQATDIVEVDMPNLPAVAYMAVVDLKTPGLAVKFGGSLTQKTLTSEFAKANACVVAINGEAGASPMANSGLGTWTGNMISDGKVLLKEDPFDRRPFLSFDRQNEATFTSQITTQRAVPADAYNVVWGRLDAVIAGAVQTESERDRQPRTAMGINDRGQLFLMVVDGRQQRYSIGFTRAEVGQFLKVFGASNGMLCDEGGSSCIYMKRFGGIVNSPSDGVERPTYTHFGIRLREP